MQTGDAKSDSVLRKEDEFEDIETKVSLTVSVYFTMLKLKCNDVIFITG